MPHSPEVEEKLQKKLKRVERLLAKTNKRLASRPESRVLFRRWSGLNVMAVEIEQKTNKGLRETHEFLKSLQPKPEDFFKRIGTGTSV